MKILISESQLRDLVSEQVKSIYKSPVGDKLNACQIRYPQSMFDQAKTHWKNWLNNPTSISKMVNNLGVTEDVIKSTYIPDWFRYLDGMQLRYVNVGYNDTLAFVDPREVNFLNMNCQYKMEDSIDIVSIMVHEMQHGLETVHPINSKDMVKSITHADYKSKTNLFTKLFKDSDVQRVCDMFGVNDINRMRKVMTYWHSVYHGGLTGYACDPGETQARVSEIRNKYNIQPGQPLPVDEFKNVFMGKLRGAQYANISWLLSCWALNWFHDDFMTYMGKLDSIAKNNVQNTNTTV